MTGMILQRREGERGREEIERVRRGERDGGREDGEI